jgi:hypothetical protein
MDFLYLQQGLESKPCREILYIIVHAYRVFSGFSLGSVFAEKIEFSCLNVVETQCVKAGALMDTTNWLKMANA